MYTLVLEVKENNDYENTVRNIFSFNFFDKLTVLYKNNIYNKMSYRYYTQPMKI